MSDASPKRLGPYELGAFLGRGGMASVYRAYQPAMKRHVAIKLIATALAEDESFVARFEHEANIAAQLEHPHILPVYDFGKEGTTAYLVMRLIEGGSLDQRIRQGPLKLSEVRRMFSQIAQALQHAHRYGVIHRDLKPSNVLLDERGNAYLTDFGIAKLMDATTSFTTTGAIVGTPAYMSPEQWAGSPASVQTDIYALAVMLFQMLTGELPFRGETPAAMMYKHLGEPPPSPATLRPDVPQAVGPIMSQALAKDPKFRYPDVEQFAQDLDDVLAGTGMRGSTSLPVVKSDQTPQPVSTEQVRTPLPIPGGDNEKTITDKFAQDALRKKPNRTLPIGIGAAVIVLLAAGVLFATSRQAPPTTPTSLPTTGPAATAVVAIAASATPLTPTALSVVGQETITETPAEGSTALAVVAGTSAATESATRAGSPTHTPTPSITLRPTRTDRPSPTNIPSKTARPTATDTEAPTVTPIPTETFNLDTPIAQTLSAQATRTANAIASFTRTPTPTLTQTPVPSTTPRPTPIPTASLTASPAGPATVTPPPTEPGITAVALAPGSEITYGQGVQGQIDSNRSAAEWLFGGRFGDQVHISVTNTSGSLQPIVRVLNSRSEFVDWNDNGGELTTIPLPADDTYKIVVSRRNLDAGTTTGTYTLTLRLVKAGIHPTDTPTSTPSITVQPTDVPTQTLTPSPTAVRVLYYGASVASYLNSPSAVDQWGFNGKANDIISVRVDSLLTVKDPPVFNVTIKGPGLTNGENSPQGKLNAIKLPQDGQFTILVTGQTGQYILALSAAPPSGPSTKVPDGFMKYGDTANQTIQLDANREMIRTFNGHARDIVTITAAATIGDLDPYLEFYGPDGSLLAKNDDSDGGRDAAIRRYVLPADGQYRIRVTRYTGQVSGGQVTLKLVLEPPAPAAISTYAPSNLISGTEKPLTYNSSYDGNLGYGQQEVFAFLGRKGEPVLIHAQRKSGNLDPTLILVDNTTRETLYASERSSSGNNVEDISKVLPSTGKYIVTLGTAPYTPNSPNQGDYRLDLRLNTQSNASGLLLPDKQVIGLISEDRPTFVYQFNGVTGQYVHIAAQPKLASQLDPFVVLMAPNGHVITFDDNVSDNDHSAVIDGAQLQMTGLYSVLVTRPGGDNGTSVGSYTLDLNISANPPDRPWITPNLFSYNKQYSGGIAGEFGDKGITPWKFNGTAGDLLTLRVTRLAGDGTLSFGDLLDPDGKVVPNKGQTSLPSGGIAGSYQLPKSGEYTINVAGDHNQYSVNGVLRANLPIVPDTLVYSDRDISSILQAGSTVTFKVNGKAADQIDLLVYWLPESGRTIIINWITPDGKSTQLDFEASLTTSKMRQTLESTGVYQLTIANNSKNDINYHVVLQGKSAEPTATPYTISLYNGQVFTGTLGPNGSSIYYFLGKGSQHLRLTLENQTAAAPELQIIGPDAKAISAKPDVNDGYVTLESDLAQTGQYTVYVISKGNQTAGAFRLTLFLSQKDAAPTPTIEATIAADRTKAVQLPYNTPAVGPIAPGSEALYWFNGQQGQKALISVYMPASVVVPVPGPTVTPSTPTAIYATVTVYDPDGNYIAEATTGQDTDRTLPTINLGTLTKTGQYIVSVRGRGTSSVTGTYYLTVRGILPNPTATVAPKNFLAFEEPQISQLTGGSVEWSYIPKGTKALFVVRPERPSPEKAATLRPSVEIYTQDGFLEASATAAQAGDEIRIAVPKLSSPAAYRIVVRALDGTGGTYTIYAAGSLGGLVVFNTRGNAFVRTLPTANAQYFTIYSGENYEAFAQSSDGQWVKVRDRFAQNKRYGWVAVRDIAVTYGDISKLPVEK